MTRRPRLRAPKAGPTRGGAHRQPLDTRTRLLLVGVCAAVALGISASAASAAPVYTQQTLTSNNPQKVSFGVAVDPAGDLFIGTDADFTLGVDELPFDASSPTSFGPLRTLPLTSPSVGSIGGLALDAAGDVFLAGVPDQVDELPADPSSPTGYGPETTITDTAGLPTDGQALGLAVDGPGDLFLRFQLDDGSTPVFKLPAGGGTWREVPLFDSVHNNVQAMTVDAAGDVFVANDTGAVTRLRVDPASPTGYAQTGENLVGYAGGNEVSAMAVDPAGNVYAAAADTNDVVEIPRDPSAFLGYDAAQTLPFTGLDGPVSLAVDTAGDVFVDYNNLVGLGNDFNYGVIELSPVTPTSLATSLSGGSASGATISVPAGTAVTDQGTLGGTNAATARGMITYSVYSDDQCTEPVGVTDTESVSDGSVSASQPFTASTPGTYYWLASYSGAFNNGDSTSTCGSEIETVTSPPAHIKVGLSAPSSVAVGATFPVSVTVDNTSPDLVSPNILAGLLVPRSLSIQSTTGGHQFGRLVYWSDATPLAPGASTTFTVELSANTSASGYALLLAGGLSLGTPVSDHGDNVAADLLKFTPAAGGDRITSRHVAAGSQTILARLRALARGQSSTRTEAHRGR